MSTYGKRTVFGQKGENFKSSGEIVLVVANITANGGTAWGGLTINEFL